MDPGILAVRRDLARNRERVGKLHASCRHGQAARGHTSDEGFYPEHRTSLIIGRRKGQSYQSRT